MRKTEAAVRTAIYRFAKRNTFYIIAENLRATAFGHTLVLISTWPMRKQVGGRHGPPRDGLSQGKCRFAAYRGSSPLHPNRQPSSFRGCYCSVLEVDKIASTERSKADGRIIIPLCETAEEVRLASTLRHEFRNRPDTLSASRNLLVLLAD